MKLTKSYEKILQDGQHQEILIESKEVKSRSEAEDLGYDDFTATLILNGQIVADISPVLTKSPAFAAMIDETDWEEEYYQKYLDVTEMHYHEL